MFGGVYKLAAVREDDGSYTPKMKLSESAEKMTIPCLKKVWRIYDQDGKAMAVIMFSPMPKLSTRAPCRIRSRTMYSSRELDAQIVQSG